MQRCRIATFAQVHQRAASVNNYRARYYRYVIVPLCRATCHGRIHPLAFTRYHLQTRPIVNQQRDEWWAIDVRAHRFAIKLSVSLAHTCLSFLRKNIKTEVVI